MWYYSLSHINQTKCTGTHNSYFRCVLGNFMQFMIIPILKNILRAGLLGAYPTCLFLSQISFLFIEFEVPGMRLDALQHCFEQPSPASRPLPRLVHVEVQNAHGIYLVLKNITHIQGSAKRQSQV